MKRIQSGATCKRPSKRNSDTAFNGNLSPRQNDMRNSSIRPNATDRPFAVHFHRTDECLREAANHGPVHRECCRANAVEERLFTLEELAKLFKVSTKTINRWREAGLVGEDFVVAGRHRLGFSRGSVEAFVNQNPQRVRRSAKFRPITEIERQQIIQNAMRLADAGQSRSAVIKQLARDTGRSVETIRQVIQRFDEHHPEAAMFTFKSGSLTKEVKQRIYQQYVSGASFKQLVRDSGRSESQIFRVVQQMRAEQIMELPLRYMAHPDFERKDAAAQILGPMPTPPPSAGATRKRPPAGLTPYLANLYEHPLLTHAQEVYLFRKYNYLKYRANQLREELDLSRPKARLLGEIESLYRQIVGTKNQIIRANLRLVVSIAKKYAQKTENFFDLVSDGNISLMKAVEKYDFGRGFKFSTYATWAIRKNFAREFSDRIRRSDRFRTSREELLGAAADERINHYEQEFVQERREREVGKILGCLSDREREIIKKRFGLNGYTHPYTLREVGNDLGVSKERVRQIESRALAKLHEAAEAAKVESP